MSGYHQSVGYTTLMDTSEQKCGITKDHIAQGKWNLM